MIKEILGGDSGQTDRKTDLKTEPQQQVEYLRLGLTGNLCLWSVSASLRQVRGVHAGSFFSSLFFP